MRDLNSLLPISLRKDWVLREAYTINERGQIVGKGSFRGRAHLFLLSPLPDSGKSSRKPDKR